jgi:hypothetical protein
LRGYPAVETIRAAGAANQRRSDLLRVIYGEAVDGRDRLR